MSYTPGLDWPKSDGSESAWPSAEDQRPSATGNWWEQLQPSHEKYRLYETSVGEFIANKKGIKAATYRMRLPPGYALFGHNKPQAAGGVRTDVYLRGCPTIGKRYFRSTKEFLPHAEWLMDESKPVDDHSTCGCIYNNQSAAAQAKKERPSLGGSSTPVVRKVKEISESASKKRKESPSESEELPSAVVPERIIDMQSGRRFRKGELIWYRIETIHPPTSNTKNLPAITHWPGLVADAKKKDRVETQMIGNVPASAFATASAISGSAPSVKKTFRVTYWEYQIRPLGFFSPSAEVTKKADSLLPWALGNELLGGGKGWELLGKEGTRVMRERVTAEVSDMRGKGIAIPTDEVEIDKKWKSTLAQRYPFKEMPKAWDTVVFRLGIAIKIATLITNSWTQTDKIDMVPGVEVNQEDLEAIQSQRRTLYQGLWWGGERIWLEDMVRLKKHRVELPVDALGLPSEGAADRAVLLKIRMITVEISPDSTVEQTSWRCLLYGDAFEVANGEGDKSAAADEKEWALFNTKAPRGLHYRQLNAAGSEVTVDIMDVAGRSYPDLLESSTQTWFSDASLSETENAERVAPGDTARALATLKPGTLVGSKSDRWKQDLYTIVSEANKLTERDMKKYFESLLQSGSKKAAASVSTAAATVTNGAAPPANTATSITA